jgi:hypothetical protein
MTFQPIVERELRVTARRSGIYRNRVLMPVLLAVILLLQWVFIPFGFSPASVGRMVYNILAYLALAVCVLDGVRQTADCVSEEKREGILRGQVLALRRTFLTPFLLVLFLEMIGIYWLLYGLVGVPVPGRPAYHDFFNIIIAVEVFFAVFFLLDIQGVAWTGIWFGLCSKNESMATFKTAFYIIVVPMLLLALYYVSCVGMLLFLAWPIAAYYWSRLQLQEHFRFLAGLRLISSGNLTSWLPFHVPNLPQESQQD